MQSIKKAISSLIEQEQKRVLLLTLNHDDELVVNGDNVSFAQLEESDVLRQALKTVLKDEPEEDDASYHFDDRLVFREDQKTEFPKLFAKIGGKRWRRADISKALSGYMKILGFGLNAPKAYGREADKPEWWPKKPKWKNFRCPSKSSKDECTKLIRRLLQSNGLEADNYYVNFPDEEEQETSSDSSSEEDADENNGNNVYQEGEGGEELLHVQEPDELSQEVEEEEEEYDGGILDEDRNLQDRITEEYSQHRKR